MLPDAASSMANEVDNLYLFIYWVSVASTLLVGAMAVYFAVKYRRRTEDYRPPPPHEHASLEIGMSVVLFIVTMIMFGWGASLFIRFNRPPADAMEMLAVGKQWMWKIEHPSGKREINELHVPLGQPIVVTMSSEDVIHSFYIPAFRVKNDVVPGRFTQVWFTPTQIGKFNLFCAQYCGGEHSLMGGWVYVMQPAEYQQWLRGVSSGPQLPPEEAGKNLFAAKACIACHTPPAAPILAPSLVGVFGSKVKLNDGTEVTADENYLRESILDSQAKIVFGYPKLSPMPLFKGQLSEEEVMQLIAYIKSLKGVAGTK